MVLLAASASVGAALPAGAGMVASSGDVAELQSQLAAAGFYRGTIDGVAGEQTAQAVMAFHKAVGVGRTTVWSAADSWYLLRWRPDLPARVGEPDRVEIDVTRQVLYLLVDGAVAAVIPVSTGSGAAYRSGSGGVAVARTPQGAFVLSRHIAGARYSRLGFMWRPWYFSGGYAIHGSRSVPAYPASHGCVRVPMWDADWLEGRLRLGMPVHVWAGSGVLAVERRRLVFVDGRPHGFGRLVAS